MSLIPDEGLEGERKKNEHATPACAHFLRVILIILALGFAVGACH